VGETAGFIRFVVDAQTDELLGMHVLAHMGADLLPQGILLLNPPQADRFGDATRSRLVFRGGRDGVGARLRSPRPS
jgi:hypothetical protein